VHRRLALAGLLGATAVLVSGCGQKGPLFWPADKIEEIERKRREGRKSGRAPRTAPPGTAVG